jgi:hypothetical protein
VERKRAAVVLEPLGVNSVGTDVYPLLD